MDEYFFEQFVSQCKFYLEDTHYLEILNYTVRCIIRKDLGLALALVPGTNEKATRRSASRLLTRGDVSPFVAS